jgi:hypothetical protein
VSDIKISVKNNRGEIYTAGHDLNVKQEAKKVDNVFETDRGRNPLKKILILSANPQVTPRLRLDKEAREIEEGLRRCKHRSQFEIKAAWAVRLRDLRRALLEYEPQIVHFAGHGTKEGLIVESELGLPVILSSKAVSGLFEFFSDQVECVILSSCYSESQAAAINKHINYVIGMPEKIMDKAAIEFAVGFYDALGVGKSFEESFEFVCNAILQIFPELSHHLIPVLKKRGRP